MTIDLHSLMAPYALHALDAHEAERFEAHLEQCPECRAELAGFVATASRLGEAEHQAPPAALRERLMHAVSTAPQERPVVTALSQRRGLRRTLPRLAMAAAFLVGMVGVGGFVIERDNVQQISAEREAITQVLGARDSENSTKTFDDGGTVKLISSASNDAAVILARDLPGLKGSKVYQVWLVKDDTPKSEGTFETSGSMVMKGLEGVDRVAITIEPSGGSKQPTTAPIATIAV